MMNKKTDTLGMALGDPPPKAKAGQGRFDDEPVVAQGLSLTCGIDGEGLLSSGAWGARLPPVQRSAEIALTGP